MRSGGGVREQWIKWRNQRLADPAFHQWAARFALTRPIAQARAKALFDLVAGFVYSQSLQACVQLGLLEILQAGPQTRGDLAERAGLSDDAALRLFGAAKALGLMETLSGDRLALGSAGAALLGAPGLKNMIAHHDRLYSDLADTVGLLGRGHGELARYWPYATSSSPRDETPEEAAAYSALMAATQPAIAGEVLAAYRFDRHKRLLDVGGGEGVFLAAAGAAAPKLELMLFDLPAVTERARAHLSQAGLLERTTLTSGDFLEDPLPKGADLITFVRILHDHDEAGVLQLLRAARAAIAPKGRVLIAEPMSVGSDDRVADVYFAFYLLAMGRGRARRPEEISALALQAGFSRSRTLKTQAPLLVRALVLSP